MQIWPAIDIRGGKCVRLIQGDYAQETTYGANPADMAHRFVGDGARHLHLVDLDGARDGSQANREAIVRIVTEVDAVCELGGGIRSESTIVDYLALGVDRLVVGTRAVNDPDWLAEMAQKYPEKLVVGIDARQDHVATEGWKKTSPQTAGEFARQISGLPLAAIVFTDISKDGMLSGPNFDAMQTMKATAGPIPLICSGGVTTIDDISRLIALQIDGCIIGKALYEGQIRLADALATARQTTVTSKD